MGEGARNPAGNWHLCMTPLSVGESKGLAAARCCTAGHFSPRGRKHGTSPEPPDFPTPPRQHPASRRDKTLPPHKADSGRPGPQSGLSGLGRLAGPNQRSLTQRPDRPSRHSTKPPPCRHSTKQHPVPPSTRITPSPDPLPKEKELRNKLAHTKVAKSPAPG